VNNVAEQLANHVKEFGLSLLGHSISYYIVTTTFDYTKSNKVLTWKAFGVVQIAHAAELIIKSCIAKEHPLLLFTKIPKLEKLSNENLTLERLLNEGKTLNYSDLPDMLWASTGYVISDIDIYREFGYLRNTIQHLAIPNIDLVEPSLKFTFKVINPLIQEFWNTNVFEHLEVDYSDTWLKELLDEYKLPY
jgi:hypothetical protein